MEFAYLVELSKIDTHFRKFVLKIALDVEHFLKLQLLNDFTNNNDEDGYDIVQELFTQNPHIKDNIDKKKKHSACADLIDKYYHSNEFAIWNIVEIISFGDFIKLYSTYYYKYKLNKSMARYLHSIKYLRNAAAHNTCLLNSLKNPYSVSVTPNKKINHFVSLIDGIDPISRKNKMSNPVVHDFIVMLYVFSKVVTSKKIKEKAFEELKYLIDVRMTKNKKYFEKNELIVSHYKFIKIVVDYFRNTSV